MPGRWAMGAARRGLALLRSQDGLSAPALEITDAAAERLAALALRHPRHALRVAVEPGGCQGFLYQFTLAPLATSDPALDLYPPVSMCFPPPHSFIPSGSSPRPPR